MKSIVEDEGILEKHVNLPITNNSETQSKYLRKESCTIVDAMIDEHNGFSTSDIEITRFFKRPYRVSLQLTNKKTRDERKKDLRTLQNWPELPFQCKHLPLRQRNRFQQAER